MENKLSKFPYVCLYPIPLTTTVSFLLFLWCAMEPISNIFIRIQRSQRSFGSFKFHVNGLKEEEFLINTSIRAPVVEKHIVFLDTRKSTASFINVLITGKAQIQPPLSGIPMSANFKADIHREPHSWRFTELFVSTIQGRKLGLLFNR